MGDRGNIAVLQGTQHEQVWFYGHWSGSSIAESVQTALKRNQRWTDDSYLARIIFCTFCSAESHDDETGFGISTRMMDNEHDIIVVDIPNQRVFLISEIELKDYQVPADYSPKDKQSWSFTEFRDLAELPEV